MVIKNLADAKKAIQAYAVELRQNENRHNTACYCDKIDGLLFGKKQIEQAETELKASMQKRALELLKEYKTGDIRLNCRMDELDRCWTIITGETKDDKLPVADPQ